MFADDGFDVRVFGGHSPGGTIDRTEGSLVNEWVPARRLAPA